MLRFLAVSNLAVIDSIEVEFEPGLNVLTGETGAGKSILVEAVGLLLGGRASGDLVRTGEELSTVQAIFEHRGDEFLVRREITAQGRSRAFVNGALATAGALKDLAGRLIELHGQHEHQTLLDPSTHLGILDAFGGFDARCAEVSAAFDALRVAADQVARVRRALADREARLDLVTFQVGELDRAALKAGEDEELASLRQVLASAERVERLCVESYATLYERDDAILAGLGTVWRRVAELAALDPQFRPYVEARDGIKSQLEDLAQFLRRYADGIEASPARLQQIEERLALLERLKRKYGPTLEDAIARRDRLRQELADLQAGDETIAALEAGHARARAAYLAVAEELSASRRRIATALARELERSVADLAMEETRFEVRFTAAPLDESEWSASGIDVAELFVSPNPGEELRPVARIVSGGELSRIMLAIKTLVAGSRQTFSDAADRPPSGEAPGLIFDEVDAGIGGRVADVVGRKLRALGSAFQVLCITHLPQIAAYADSHFLIDKRVEQGRTRTSVQRLDEAARVEELARMLGGEAVTEGIRASAREMLDGRKSAPAGAGRESTSPKGSGTRRDNPAEAGSARMAAAGARSATGPKPEPARESASRPERTATTPRGEPKARPERAPRSPRESKGERRKGESESHRRSAGRRGGTAHGGEKRKSRR